MDLTELRAERLRTVLLGVQERAHLLAGIHLAVLVFAATIVASAAVAHLTGQLARIPAAIIVLAAVILVLLQLRALVKVLHLWERSVEQAVAELDMLIREEAEAHVDVEEA